MTSLKRGIAIRQVGPGRTGSEDTDNAIDYVTAWFPRPATGILNAAARDELRKIKVRTAPLLLFCRALSSQPHASPGPLPAFPSRRLIGSRPPIL